MTIWKYPTAAREPQFIWSLSSCPFCQSDLRKIHQKSFDTRQARLSISNRSTIFTAVSMCPVCGWWVASEHFEGETIRPELMNRSTRGACASLVDLDLSDLTLPMSEVRAFLAARYEARNTINPRLFEETVASVFVSLGYNATVTAYSGDGGIDVILQKGRERIGVQVKRYQNSICVEQIRSLAGAMLLNGMTQGIFVTTSTFQRGTSDTVNRYDVKGYRIDLVDAPRFFDMLKLSQMSGPEEFSLLDIDRCLASMQLIEHCEMSNHIF